MEAILSLGTNLGDRLANLVEARDRLAALPGTRIVACAPIYETDPVGVREAYLDLRYLNTILVLETALDPEVFSKAMHAIEDRMGRLRGPDRNSPRVIDIDLIVFGDIRQGGPALCLPHPEAMRRRFVCQPLADVRPDLLLPGHSHTIREQLVGLPEKPAVLRATEQWTVR